MFGFLLGRLIVLLFKVVLDFQAQNKGFSFPSPRFVWSSNMNSHLHGSFFSSSCNNPHRHRSRTWSRPSGGWRSWCHRHHTSLEPHEPLASRLPVLWELTEQTKGYFKQNILMLNIATLNYFSDKLVTFKCLSANTHSMGNKPEESEMCAHLQGYDLIGITERWWGGCCDRSVRMEGHKVFQKNRSGRWEEVSASMTCWNAQSSTWDGWGADQELMSQE